MNKRNHIQRMGIGMVCCGLMVGAASMGASEDDVLRRPGLVANRETQRVTFSAKATGIGTDDPIEFFLIGPKSGNDYEAIAVTEVEPRDIYDAMEFIGMTPGRGINPDALQFWPKGERVHLTIGGHRAETLIFNSETQRPLDPDGLVFTGSRFIPAATNTQQQVLAAQVRGPYSVAANYNEPESLFGVPYRAPQSAVYAMQTRNPDITFSEEERLDVVIEPEYKNGKKRVKDLMLHVARGAGNAAALVSCDLTVRDTDGVALNDDRSLTGALALFSRLNDEGHDPFVTVDIGDHVTVAQLHALAVLLKRIESKNGIRVDPPPAGQLYYKAFAPNEAYRNRENRYLQPWELHLEWDADGSLTAMLTEITEIWTQGEPKPDFKTEDHPVASPAMLVERLTASNPDVKVLLVYAPRLATHAQIMRYIRPARPTHPLVHVYMEPGPDEDLHEENEKASGAD